VILAVTQTGHGSVDLHTYHAGAGLIAAGVISGKDITLPAAVAKLQILLAAQEPGQVPDVVSAITTTTIAGESAR
jgi:L-asparaginase/Glu-tRNA(Gln) amidotransferase subunit D